MTAFDRSPGGKADSDRLLAAALAVGATITDAAAAAGMSARTARRRLADPDFARHVRDSRADHITHTSTRLAGLSDLALDAMESLLDARTPPAVRARVAHDVLEARAVWRAATEVDQRIAALERAADGYLRGVSA